MELVYTNADGIDSGILTNFSMDHEESSEIGKNTFEIKVDINSPIELGSLIYQNNTEYGGRLTKVTTDTSTSKATYSGITWRGLLEQHIIRPDPGEDYLILSGQMNDIIDALITRNGLEEYYYASGDDAPIITYKFDRYTSMLKGIQKMLNKYNYKIKLSAFDGRVEIGAVPITDYSQDGEINSDLFSFKLTRQKYTCNHLIALGSGELTERMVIDLYVGKDGSIGTTQYYTGVEEVTETYELTNAESLEDLQEKAIEQLTKKKIADGLKITAYNLNADIGDKITAIDLNQKISVTQFVVNKIVTINDDYIKYQYKVGDTL